MSGSHRCSTKELSSFFRRQVRILNFRPYDAIHLMSSWVQELIADLNANFSVETQNFPIYPSKSGESRQSSDSPYRPRKWQKCPEHRTQFLLRLILNKKCLTHKRTETYFGQSLDEAECHNFALKESDLAPGLFGWSYSDRGMESMPQNYKKVTFFSFWPHVWRFIALLELLWLKKLNHFSVVDNLTRARTRRWIHRLSLLRCKFRR